MLKKWLIAAVSLGCMTFTPLYAQGIVLNDEQLRQDLNWLNQQGVIQISTSMWPLSADEIEHALETAKIQNSSQEKVIDAVKIALKQDNIPLTLGVFAESEQKNLPQTFADDVKAQYQVRIEGNAGSDNWDAKLRINAEKDLQIDHGQELNLEGSYLAGKLWNQWLIAGQIPTYWGPGHEGC